MRSNTPTELTIIKPRLLKQEFEFISAGQPVGKLKVQGPFKLSAQATLFNEEWSLNKTGIWQTFIEYKAAQRPFTKGRIQKKMRGRTELKASDGKTYTFRKIKWWKSSWAWYDRDENPVIEMRQDHSFTNKQAHFIIHNPDHAETTLMILIAWFVMLIQRRNAAAAAA